MYNGAKGEIQDVADDFRKADGIMAVLLPHGLKELIAVAAAAETVTLLPNMKNYSEI